MTNNTPGTSICCLKYWITPSGLFSIAHWLNNSAEPSALEIIVHESIRGYNSAVRNARVIPTF